MTDALFFCGSSQCPGYDYKASERSHPVDSCGRALNTLDGRIWKIIDAPEPTSSIDAPTSTEPNNESPEVPSGDEIAILTEDMPQLADDSPAAKGEVLEEIIGEVLEEVIEEIPAEPGTATNRMRPATSPPPAIIDGAISDEPLPSPLDSMMPRTVENHEDFEHFLVENSDAPLARAPRVGTCWVEAMTSKNEVRCYEVVGVNATSGYALCEFHSVPTRSKQECLICLPHFINGDLVPFLTPPPFIRYSIRKSRDVKLVYPLIADPESRGLFPSPTLITYVPFSGSLWRNQVGENYLVEFVDERLFEVSEKSQPRVTVRVWIGSVHSLARAFIRLVEHREFLDGSLEFKADLRDYSKSRGWENNLPSESPEEAQPVEERARIDIGSVEEHQVSVFELIQEIADELDVAYPHVTRLVDSALSTVLAALRMKGVIATSPAIAAIQAFISKPEFVETVRTMFWRTMSADEAPDLRQVVDYINRDLEPRIDKLCAHSDNLSTPETLAEIVARHNLVMARMNVLETNLADIGAPPSQSKASKSAEPVPEGPSRPGTAKRKPGRPKGSTSAKSKMRQVPLFGSSEPAKRGPGRPPKNKAKPIAKSPNQGNLHPWNHFIDSAAITRLLRKIPNGNVSAFLAQARTHLPEMSLTRWTASEQSKFATWYLKNQGNFAKR